MTVVRRVLTVAGWTTFVALVSGAVLVVLALVAGYRPVVITTGSMGDRAPAGSVMIAAPSDAVEVGDILVMRRDGLPTITHRVVELEEQGDVRYAVTKGDANDAADLEPYRIGENELVERWTVPGAGSALTAIADPKFRFGIVAFITLLVVAGVLARIWFGPPQERVLDDDGQPLFPRVQAHRRRTRVIGMGAAALGVIFGGAAWSVYVNAESVGGNTFTTPACFDARVGSVQKGQLVNTVPGAQSVTITAVDPTASFLLFSVRSNDGEPDDSMVQGRLASATTLEFTRDSDDVVPPPVTIQWSVVEYACGVTVQRGVVPGDGTDLIDVPVANAPLAASFVTISKDSGPGDTVFSGDDQVIAELTSPTNLQIRTGAGGPLPTNHSMAWQIVTFTDPADVSVQTLTTSLTGASLTDTPTITPVDRQTTMVLASVASTGLGAIDDHTVRVHLASATEVEVTRQATGDDVEVHIQVVELLDGTKVAHGTVDFAPGEPAQAVTISPVDPAVTTAISTVQTPGSASGGNTDLSADDVIGEASATLEVTDPTTITLIRDATTANASFGWQAISWGGPSWGDPASPFRQRIDVTAGSVAAPDGYSVPVTFSHAALVVDGFSAASGDDIRIMRWDGSAWSELDRVVDDDSSWNAADTTIWFRTVAPVGADTTDSYWMYFGDPSPPAPRDDPENVWLLTEDFDSATLGDFEDRTVGSGWYQALPWTRRVPITVPAAQVGADLVDYPLLVQFTLADLGANARADGRDLRFTAADGTTPLAHELESWDGGTGTITAWVRVPLLSSGTDTTVYLYYGASDSPTQEDVRGTWAGDMLGVWHLARDPDGSAPHADDATTANHDGLGSGAMSAADLVAGRAGPAVDLDGSDDRMDIAPWAIAVTELTASGWVRLDGFTDPDPIVISQASDLTTRVLDLAVDDIDASTGSVRLRLDLDGSGQEVNGGSLSTGAWHHVAGTWDGTTMRAYLDGVEVAATPATGTLTQSPTMPVTLGDVTTADRSLDGLLDEVRLESVARSAEWLAATVANHTNPSAFAVPGAPEAGSWFGQGTWAMRKPMTVDATAVDGPLADFPLLVQVVDADLAATAQADGDDIVFTAGDGVTRLDHEIESYDSGTGALTAWVRVPVLDDATDTELFMYFSNPGAVAQQDPTAVFGGESDLVAHLSG